MTRRPFGRDGEERLARMLLIPCNQRLNNRELGELLGVSDNTIKHHKQAALRLMERWQLEPVSAADLVAVERALLKEAQDGNVPAAKILFERLRAAAGRWLGRTETPAAQTGELPSVAELEAALVMLKGDGSTTP